jgi:hypothetical protein
MEGITEEEVKLAVRADRNGVALHKGDLVKIFCCSNKEAFKSGRLIENNKDSGELAIKVFMTEFSYPWRIDSYPLEKEMRGEQEILDNLLAERKNWHDEKIAELEGAISKVNQDLKDACKGLKTIIGKGKQNRLE